jgi:hypothetical protein
MDGDIDRKHKNREAIGHHWGKIGRETAAGIASGRLSSFTNTSATLSIMRGSSPPGLGVCGSILYQSISMYFII